MYEDKELLKNFLKDQFDFKELKKIGFYKKEIKATDYQAQADRICQYFGLETVYQYNFTTTHAHISYVDGHRPEGEGFITEFKAYHEN